MNITEDSGETGGATANDDSEETNCENTVPSMVHAETDSKLIISAEGLSSTTVFLNGGEKQLLTASSLPQVARNMHIKLANR